MINDLPLNGRNFENLLDLRPGVVKYPGNAGWTQATNGLRPHDNFFLVDGIDANDPWMAQSMMNAVMAAGDAGTMLPIDAINEFQTQQNPRAEYGWKPGAVVNVGIKSGSNSFHGTAYAYGRTSAWDANNFFSNEVGQALPPLALEQYGASVGGPIIRDKLFFFGNFESQQYNVGSPFVHTVPYTAAGTVNCLEQPDRRLQHRIGGGQPQRAQRATGGPEQQLCSAFELSRIVPEQLHGELRHGACQHRTRFSRELAGSITASTTRTRSTGCFSRAQAAAPSSTTPFTKSPHSG